MKAGNFYNTLLHFGNCLASYFSKKDFLEFLNPLFCFSQALGISFYDNAVLEMDFQMLRAYDAYPKPCHCEEKSQPVTDCSD